MSSYSLKSLFDESSLQSRIVELGEQITADYAGEEVTMIGILKGAVVFLSDLIRSTKLPVSIEFIGVGSYEGTASTGHVRIVNDLATDIQGKHVILVEDIVDTGRTIDYLLNVLAVREPKSLKICTLLSKPHAHVMHHTLDYIGFEIGREFVVGFGLDYDGKFRNLPYLAQVIFREDIKIPDVPVSR